MFFLGLYRLKSQRREIDMRPKKVMLLILCTSFLFGGTKHILGQWVTNVPIGYEKTGYKIYVYDMANPLINVLDGNSDASEFVWTGTGKLEWKMDLAHFPIQWSRGDIIMSMGSWDSTYAVDSTTYGDNPGHTGFCWFYTDTLDDKSIQNWEPDDTLRALPKPLVSKTGPGGSGNDTIWIRIPNIKETRRGDQTTYDVLGYWLWADTTGTGTPNAFDAATAVEIGIIPVQGAYGDTTVLWMLESDHFAGWDHYSTFFAYKLVFLPDTTGTDNPDSPGYSTYYFSRNSDDVDVYQNVVGKEESIARPKDSPVLQICPNPFFSGVNFIFSLDRTESVRLTVYDSSGRLVSKVLDEVRPAGIYRIEFDGFDKNNIPLPEGVYFYRFYTDSQQYMGKIVRL